MTFLPIVERELRVRARQWITYRLRLAGALVASAIAIFLLVIGQLGANPTPMGLFLFKMLASLTFLFCLFEGARQTADSLSGEKRNGTLGLLFLTDLKAYDVVLGKWIACALPSFYVLLAVLPLLALPLLLGGVTGGEFARLVLVLVDALLLSLSVGMLISALSRDERRAWTGTTSLLLIFTLLPPLLRSLPLPGIAFCSALSPGCAFVMLNQPAYNARPWGFWQPVLGVQILAWACLLAGCLALPRAWQDRPAQPRRRASRRMSPPSLMSPSLEANPVAWLAGYTAPRHSATALFAGILIVLVSGLVVHFWSLTWRMPVAGGVLFAATGLHLLLGIWVAYHASYLFAQARASGFLELLLATPLSARDILHGYLLALKRRCFGPVILLLILES